MSGRASPCLFVPPQILDLRRGQDARGHGLGGQPGQGFRLVLLGSVPLHSVGAPVLLINAHDLAERCPINPPGQVSLGHTPCVNRQESAAGVSAGRVHLTRIKPGIRCGRRPTRHGVLVEEANHVFLTRDARTHGLGARTAPGRTPSTRSRTGPGSSTRSTPPGGARSASTCRGGRRSSAWLPCACRSPTAAGRSSSRSLAGTGSRSSTPPPSR